MKYFLYKIFIILTILISITFSFSLADDLEDDELIDVNSEIISPANTKDKKLPSINSRAYVVIDRNTNTVLCGKNENVQRKMASTTKIMTAIVILENCNLNDIVTVSKNAANTGGSRLGLNTNDKISVHDLLYGLMLCSGNDAAVALAEHASGSVSDFANLMNKKVKELSLKNTHFETPHGLDSENHYTTAYELAILSNYSLKNKVFSQIVGTKNYTVTINGISKQLSNTNELLGSLDGVYGVKTGFTNGANRCLVSSCKRGNMDIICVVLGADTKKFRTSDSIKLINYVFNNFDMVNIQEMIDKEFNIWKDNNSNTFTINKGISNDIDLNLRDLKYKSIPVKKNLINSISLNINCDKYLNAPIYENTDIGSIEIKINDEIIGISNIYATCSVSKKNFIYYIIDIFKNYCEILEKTS